MARIRKSQPQEGIPLTGDQPPGKVNLASYKDKNWVADLNRFIARYGRVRSRDVTELTGRKTMVNRRQVLHATFKRLVNENRGIATLSQLRPRLAARIVAMWDADGVAPNTQVTYFSTLSWFWAMHGDAPKSITEVVTDPQRYVVRSAAQHDRSISAKLGDPQIFIDALKAKDQRMGWFAQLAIATGMRKAECLHLDPHANDLGDKLNIVSGAKGGRKRTIDLRVGGEAAYAAAREALDALKQMTPVGSHAGWPGLSLKQGEQKFEDLCKAAGATKSAMGVTFHGCRHEYAINTLELHTGQPAPIRGGTVVNYGNLTEYKRLVSRQLGHNRPKVTGAYYGSFDAMDRRAHENFMRSWELLKPHMEHLRSHLLTYDIEGVFLIGTRARGLEPLSPTAI